MYVHVCGCVHVWVCACVYMCVHVCVHVLCVHVCGEFINHLGSKFHDNALEGGATEHQPNELHKVLVFQLAVRISAFEGGEGREGGRGRKRRGKREEEKGEEGGREGGRGRVGHLVTNPNHSIAHRHVP